MNYAQFKQQENIKLVATAFSTFRGEEDLDYLSDATLWEICKAWPEDDGDLSFEDFVDYYLTEIEG